MIALFKGKYHLADYEFIGGILDEVLIHHAMCDSNCSSCDKHKACKDLNRLHKYVHEAIEIEKNSEK